MIIPENLVTPNVIAFFTTRDTALDGHSLSQISGFPEDKIFMPSQHHTDTVIILESELKKFEADGVITDKKGILIGVRVADCVPIIIYNRASETIGVVHAGWRGIAKGILKKTIQLMVNRFSFSADDISIAMGPSIRTCCYRVGEYIVEAVKKITGNGNYYLTKKGKHFLDLAAANKFQAISQGIPDRNIWISRICTCCNPEFFYSYRYAKTPERQGGFIGLRN